MLNIKEKNQLLIWCASMIYNTHECGPAAYALRQAGRDLIEMFSLNEDIEFYLQAELFEQLNISDDGDEKFEAFCEIWEARGEDFIVDLIDAGKLIKEIDKAIEAAE